MAISHIKNKYARRGILVVALVPGVLGTFAWHVVLLAAEIVRDIPYAVRGCWRGE